MGKKKHQRGRAEAKAAKAAKREAKAAARAARRPRAEAAPETKRSKRKGPARPVLRGISEIRAFLRTNRTPIHFISPTPFNLLGIDRWVRDFFFVSYYDCFEGTHPRVFVPQERPWREFKSIEEINDYLLAHKEVRRLRALQGRPWAGRLRHVRRGGRAPGARARAAHRHPSAALRQAHRLQDRDRPAWPTRPACRRCPTSSPASARTRS